jgi:hypothetical protein
MDETRQQRDPTRPGLVAEGQIELNRELTRQAPEASREQVEQEQEALQRARPEAVREAAAGGPVAGGAAPEESDQTTPRGAAEASGAERSPFADAATTTRAPRGEAG